MKLEDFSIAFVIGTRAELIKCFPLMLELKNNKIPYYFISTGQHNLNEFSKQFGIKSPDIVLSLESDKSSKFNSKISKALVWGVGIFFKIKRELKKLPNLKYVIYHGDTMSTGLASVSTSKMFNWFKKYKNVHLEAGLRSFNNKEPFPEEIMRKIATYFSDVLLAVSDKAYENLKRYHKRKQVFDVGNSVVDSVYIALDLAKQKKVKRLNKRDFAVVTIHRHENLVNKERLNKIVDILLSVKIPTYFAIHDNSRKKFEEFNLIKKLEQNKNIHLIQPMDYISFIYQMSQCKLIICDGGSMQEESLIFGKPCVILRMETERQEGLKTNFQFLTKLNVKKSKEKIYEYLSKGFEIKEYKNPYGEKGVCKKIVGVLK
ncbi:MAG: UDP-N-acetylglucosamine 2-epimerase [Candidatus Pacearchaeota archaeon]